MRLIPINYSDPGFNAAFTTDFQLVVVLNQNTFSYAVRHAATQTLVRISTGHPLTELFEPNDQFEAFTSSYQKVIFAAETNSFCLVPEAIFTPDNLPDFAAFLLVKEADTILTDEVENGQNKVIFTFPEELFRKIENQFPTSKIEFAPKSWIKTVIQARLYGQNLYLFLDENQLRVLLPDQENIRFYNQFSCSTTDELVYFTALVAEQLMFKPEETTLVVCGRVEEESEQVLRLRQFFKEVVLFATMGFQQRDLIKQHQVIQFLGFN